MDINDTNKCLEIRTPKMQGTHLWHALSHVAYALINLTVLGLCAYHLTRYDGYGFYDYDDGPHQTDNVWNKNLDNDGLNNEIPRYAVDIMNKVCKDKQDYDIYTLHARYRNYYTLNTAWRWGMFFDEMKVLENGHKYNVDIGNPIDKIKMETKGEEFPICIKASSGVGNDEYGYQSICSVLEHDSHDADSHGSASHARNCLIAIVSFSCVFFIAQVLYAINLAHMKGAVHAHDDVLKKKSNGLFNKLLLLGGMGAPADLQKIDGSDEPAGMRAMFFFWAHIVMYTESIVTPIILLVMMNQENSETNSSFSFETAKGYDHNNNCFNTPYDAAVHMGINNLKNSKGQTTEFKVAQAIFIIYICVSAISMLIYAQLMKNPFKITGKKVDGVNDDPLVNESIGGRIAERLFNRGKKIVNLQF